MFNCWSQWWSPLSIKEDIIYKKRNDLKNFKSKRPESIFVEAITPSTKNIIAGCIYHHPCMELTGEILSIFHQCEMLVKNSILN